MGEGKTIAAKTLKESSSIGWYIGQSVVDQPEWDLIAPRIKHSWRICRRRSPLNGQLVVGQSGAVVGADQPHGWLLQRDNYSRFGIILRAYKVDLLMSGHNHCSAHARGRLRTHTGFIAYKTESDTMSSHVDQEVVHSATAHR